MKMYYNNKVNWGTVKLWHTGECKITCNQLIYVTQKLSVTLNR